MTTRESTATTIDTAQYALAAFLAVAGIYVIIDASSLKDGFADQPVQPYAFPYVIGGALMVLAVLLAIVTARGDRPAAEEGEDVDLAEPADWVTVVKLVVVFVVNMALIDLLSWAVTGAILFAGSAWALGSRTLIRDVAIGAVLSVGSWYFFYSVLGLAMPAGILDGVL